MNLDAYWQQLHVCTVPMYVCSICPVCPVCPHVIVTESAATATPATPATSCDPVAGQSFHHRRSALTVVRFVPALSLSFISRCLPV
jgi:hypothetical protein